MAGILSSAESKTVLFVFLFLIFCTSASFAASGDFSSGMDLLKQKNYSAALACFDKTVDADPTNGEVHFWRGKCLSYLSRSKEAVAEFKMAYMLSSDAKTKDLCRVELSANKVAAPKASISPALPTVSSADGSRVVVASDGGASKGEKFFKLSSKKLEWNLQMSDQYLSSMNSRTQNLGNIAAGRRWRSPSQVAMNRAVDIRSALQDGPSHFNIPLSADEKNVLSRSDIFIILDHSGSMSTIDCPSRGGGVEPRLFWCTEELEDFSSDLLRSLPHGFHLISFDSKPEVTRISSAEQLRRQLQSLQIGGGTDLPAALKEAFRLHGAHPLEPLLIAVVTDGEIDLHSSESTIAEATHRFPLPNGVFITMLQVGIISEIHTNHILTALDNLRERSGASYEAFVAVPFSRLRREGLGRDLLIAVRANSLQPEKPDDRKSDQVKVNSGKNDGTNGSANSKENSGKAEPAAATSPVRRPVMWRAGGN